MPVRYLTSDGGKCATAAQRRVNRLYDLQRASTEATFLAPVEQQLLDNTGAELDVPQIFNTTQTDATTSVTTALPVQYEIFLEPDTRLELGVEYSIPFHTVNDPTAVAEPTAFEGSPFFIRHESISHDPVTGNEVIEATADHFLPQNYYIVNGADTGTYLPDIVGLLVATGVQHIATESSTNLLHRFTLMWLSETGDWNQANTLGGYIVEPWANNATSGYVGLPFPTTSASTLPMQLLSETNRPQLLTFTPRLLPANASCNCAVSNNITAAPWLTFLHLSAAELALIVY